MPSRPPPGSRIEASRPQPWSLIGAVERDPACRQFGDGRLDVVADQVELDRAGGLGRVHRHLAGRQLQDQPAAAGVDRRQTEQILEEGPVGLGVGAVEDDVRAADHPAQP